MNNLKLNFNVKNKVIKIKIQTKNGDIIKFKYTLNSDNITPSEINRAMIIVEALRNK